jgi:hypothetical protein
MGRSPFDLGANAVHEHGSALPLFRCGYLIEDRPMTFDGALGAREPAFEIAEHELLLDVIVSRELAAGQIVARRFDHFEHHADTVRDIVSPILRASEVIERGVMTPSDLLLVHGDVPPIGRGHGWEQRARQRNPVADFCNKALKGVDVSGWFE